eukprot:gene14503-20530_t
MIRHLLVRSSHEAPLLLTALDAIASTSAACATRSPQSGSASSLCAPSFSNRDFSSSSGRQGAARVNWDWAFVVGAKAGRKPAIKKPRRHQWYYCNPNYDPNLPVSSERKRMVPFAPPTASMTDDQRAFKETKPDPGMSWKKHRAAFSLHLQLRDIDWRYAFEDGLSKYTKEEKKKLMGEQEAQRQQSWRAYKEQLFTSCLIAEDVGPAAPAVEASSGKKAQHEQSWRKYKEQLFQSCLTLEDVGSESPTVEVTSGKKLEQ